MGYTIVPDRLSPPDLSNLPPGEAAWAALAVRAYVDREGGSCRASGGAILRCLPGVTEASQLSLVEKTIRSDDVTGPSPEELAERGRLTSHLAWLDYSDG